MTTPFLDARGISYAWPTGGAIRRVSLRVDAGEMVGVVGPNGAGKSTLLRILTAYLKPAEGEVTLKGEPLCSYGRRRAARAVAFVPQYADLNLPFTVAELAMLARYSYLGAFGKPGPRDRDAVLGALTSAGVAHLADRRVNELSGGEYQRAALARALAQDPELLVLDEPTAHLDISHQGRTFALLRALNGNKGLTVVAAIHDLNIAAYYFPRVVLMAEGEIVEDGPAADVLTEKKLESVYRCAINIWETPQRRLIYPKG